MYHYTSKIYSKKILNELSNKRIIVSSREKNIVFLKRYGLLQKSVEEIIKSLTENHFIEKRKNNNESINCDFVYIFKPLVMLNDINGDVLKYVYIKICEINNNDILVISIHEDDD